MPGDATGKVKVRVKQLPSGGRIVQVNGGYEVRTAAGDTVATSKKPKGSKYDDVREALTKAIRTDEFQSLVNARRTIEQTPKAPGEKTAAFISTREIERKMREVVSREVNGALVDALSKENDQRPCAHIHVIVYGRGGEILSNVAVSRDCPCRAWR